MADSVNTTVLRNSDRYYAVQITNICDGTGESDVKKVDVSTLSGPNGQTTTYLSLLEAKWSIQGFTYVKLEFDATTDDELLVMSGDGGVSFEAFGGLVDPKSTGTTGDIFLTTAGNTSGDSYDITLVFKKKV